MSLITKKTRIDAKRVAEIIGCSRKTVLNGGAGTSQLTRIRNGSRQVRFILEEVETLVEKQMKRAQGEPLNHAHMDQVCGRHQLLTT
jgi:predicted DNA-binding transcriptional regulator AlpA